MTRTLPGKEEEFWETWKGAQDQRRFEYEINRELVILLLLFSLTMVGLSCFLGVVMELGGWGWVLIGVLATALMLGTSFVVFVWYTFARRSAILVQDDALVWLYVGGVNSLGWNEMDRDLVAQALSGAKGTHGMLNFEVAGETKTLLAYNPYMRVKNFPGLMLEILERLQTDETKSTENNGDQ